MHKEAQSTPDEANIETTIIQKTVASTVKAVEQNKKAIARWFFKGLFAFNLLFGSIVFWVVVVPHLVQSS